MSNKFLSETSLQFSEMGFVYLEFYAYSLVKWDLLIWSFNKIFVFVKDNSEYISKQLFLQFLIRRFAYLRKHFLKFLVLYGMNKVFYCTSVRIQQSCNYFHNILRLFDALQHLLSRQVKGSAIISDKHGIYQLPHKFPNDS